MVDLRFMDRQLNQHKNKQVTPTRMTREIEKNIKLDSPKIAKDTKF